MKHNIPNKFKNKLAKFSDSEFSIWMKQVSCIDIINQIGYGSIEEDIFDTRKGAEALHALMWMMMPGNLCNPLSQVLGTYERAMKSSKEDRWQYISYHEMNLLNKIENQKLSWYNKDCYKIFEMITGRKSCWYVKYYAWYRILGRKIMRLFSKIEGLSK